MAHTGGLDGAAFLAARTLLTQRQNISAKRLVAPGPSDTELEALLHLAAAAPDHGQLTPWRFVTVPVAQRERLATVFAEALVDRDAGATAAQIQAARDKAHRAPLLLVAIVCLGPREPSIPAPERLVSLGAAIQNLLLAAQARGYGSGLSSGRALQSPLLREAFGIAEGEHAVCFISLGTPLRSKSARQRPAVDAFVRWV